MKHWVRELEQHVESWSRRLDGDGRGWWPRYIYHFTDVTNAISILNEGRILSRRAASDFMENDNADPEVIAQTNPAHFDFVRLFFRPLTPTQYHVEGNRPLDARVRGHCPVPVFFLFDFVSLVGRDGVKFSNGTMASSRYGYSDSQESFQKIRFDDVYHHRELSIEETSRKREIIQARQAEVLVESALELGPELRAIFCRSRAERQTLLHGLNRDAIRRWHSSVEVSGDNLYFQSRLYVVQVHSPRPRIIEFELSQKCKETRSALFLFVADSGNSYESSIRLEPGTKRMSFRLPRFEGSGVVTLRLDDCLAHEGRLTLSRA